MATIPSGNQPISMSQINAEWGLGKNIGAYLNRRWFRADNSRGYFQASGPIHFSDFAGKRATTPVSANSATFYGSQYWSIPIFNTLYVYVQSGQGGQGGQSGNGGGGSPGGPGGPSAFGGYLYEPGGAGGAGGSGGGGVYTGSFSWSIATDADYPTYAPHYGETVYITVGGGGGGGGGGFDIACGFGFCVTAGRPAGSNGANGYVSVSWS
jgi:hypothetical protein